MFDFVFIYCLCLMKFRVKRIPKNSILKNYSKWSGFLIFYTYICNVIDDFLFLYLQH